MSKKNAASYEKYLNELYTDSYSEEQAIDNFCYLNDGKIKNSTISRYYTNHELGTLVRRLDPVAFYAGFNDWKR